MGELTVQVAKGSRAGGPGLTETSSLLETIMGSIDYMELIKDKPKGGALRPTRAEWESCGLSANVASLSVSLAVLNFNPPCFAVFIAEVLYLFVTCIPPHFNFYAIVNGNDLIFLSNVHF